MTMNTEFSPLVLWVGQQALSCPDPTFLPFHKVSFAHFNFRHDVATTAMFDMLLLLYVLLLLRSLICCYYLYVWYTFVALMFDFYSYFDLLILFWCLMLLLCLSYLGFSFSSRDFETSTRLSSKDGLSAYIKFVWSF